MMSLPHLKILYYVSVVSRMISLVLPGPTNWRMTFIRERSRWTPSKQRRRAVYCMCNPFYWVTCTIMIWTSFSSRLATVIDTKNTCGMCGKEIQYTGKYWEHTGGWTPSHTATPTNKVDVTAKKPWRLTDLWDNVEHLVNKKCID